MRVIVLVAFAALLLAAAPAPVAHAATFTLTATNFKWTPQVLNVDIGDSVSIVSGGGVHRWVRDDSQGACNLPCTQTFNTGGVIHYHCGVQGFSMVGVIQVGPSSNLPTATITSPADGADVSGTVTVTGTAVSPTNAAMSVYAYFEGGSLQSATLSGSSWSVALPTAPLTNGAHALNAIVVDSAGQSSATIATNVANTPTYDVYVTSLTASNPDRTAGPVLTFTLRNDGNSPTPAYHIRAEYLYKTVWHPIAEIVGPTIAAHGAAQGDISWTDGLHVGKYPVRVIGDDQNQIAELSEANNVQDTLGSWFTDRVPGTDPQDP